MEQRVFPEPDRGNDSRGLLIVSGRLSARVAAAAGGGIPAFVGRAIIPRKTQREKDLRAF